MDTIDVDNLNADRLKRYDTAEEVKHLNRLIRAMLDDGESCRLADLDIPCSQRGVISGVNFDVGVDRVVEPGDVTRHSTAMKEHSRELSTVKYAGCVSL